MAIPYLAHVVFAWSGSDGTAAHVVEIFHLFEKYFVILLDK